MIEDRCIYGRKRNFVIENGSCNEYAAQFLAVFSYHNAALFIFNSYFFPLHLLFSPCKHLQCSFLSSLSMTWSMEKTRVKIFIIPSLSSATHRMAAIQAITWRILSIIQASSVTLRACHPSSTCVSASLSTGRSGMR